MEKMVNPCLSYGKEAAEPQPSPAFLVVGLGVKRLSVAGTWWGPQDKGHVLRCGPEAGPGKVMWVKHQAKGGHGLWWNVPEGRFMTFT